MGTEKEKLEQLFLDNAPKLVRYTIKKNQEAIKYFGSFEDMDTVKQFYIELKKDENFLVLFAHYLACKV